MSYGEKPGARLFEVTYSLGELGACMVLAQPSLTVTIHKRLARRVHWPIAIPSYWLDSHGLIQAQE